MAVESVGGRPIAVVLFSAEDLLADASDVETVLTHEYLHVLHAAMGGFSDSPLWLQEGLARWAEATSEQDLQRWVALYFVPVGTTPFRPAAELLASEQSMSESSEWDQAVAGIAFFLALERGRGDDFCRLLADRVLRSSDWRAALEAQCAEPMPQILLEVRTEFSRWAQSLGPSLAELDDAVQLYRIGESAGALNRLDAALAGEFPEALRPQAEQLRWRVSWQSGHVDDARELMRAYRLRYRHDPIAKRSWFEELEMLKQARRWTDVAEVARAILRDSVWASRDADQRARVTQTLADAERAIGR